MIIYCSARKTIILHLKMVMFLPQHPKSDQNPSVVPETRTIYPPLHIGVSPAGFGTSEPLQLFKGWINAIHRINHYPENSEVCLVTTYPLDSNLSGG